MLGDVQLAGSNASAEEADEGTDEASESGVDLVLNHRLVETGAWGGCLDDEKFFSPRFLFCAKIISLEKLSFPSVVVRILQDPLFNSLRSVTGTYYFFEPYSLLGT